jgi:tetratricopeptide (TPR) repeat protein
MFLCASELQRLKEYETTINIYNFLIRTGTGTHRGKALIKKARLLRLLENFQEALEEYKNGEKIFCDKIYLLIEIGITLEKLGRINEAKEYFKKAQKLGKDNWKNDYNYIYNIIINDSGGSKTEIYENKIFRTILQKESHDKKREETNAKVRARRKKDNTKYIEYERNYYQRSKEKQKFWRKKAIKNCGERL